MSNQNHFRFPRFLSIFLPIILIITVCVFFAADIAIGAINSFSDYEFSCRILKRNIFQGLEFKNVCLRDKAETFEIKIGEMSLRLEGGALFKQKQCVMECVAKVVLFEGNAGNIFSPKTDDALLVSFGPGREYEKIQFKMIMDKDTFQVLGFNAESKDIKVNGDYSLLNKGKNVSMNVKIAFSPEAVKEFDHLVRENMLTLDTDGWYSTVIEYKGDPELLRALSMVVIPA